MRREFASETKNAGVFNILIFLKWIYAKEQKNDWNTQKESDSNWPFPIRRQKTIRFCLLSFLMFALFAVDDALCLVLN